MTTASARGARATARPLGPQETPAASELAHRQAPRRPRTVRPAEAASSRAAPAGLCGASGGERHRPGRAGRRRRHPRPPPAHPRGFRTRRPVHEGRTAVHRPDGGREPRRRDRCSARHPPAHHRLRGAARRAVGPAGHRGDAAPPGAGLAPTSAPRAPFRTRKGAARKIVLTPHVTEYRKPPRNTGLAFVGVTLRNAHAIRLRRFPLGPRFARDLSAALQVACSNDLTSPPKSPRRLTSLRAVLRILTMWTGRITPHSAVPPAKYRSALPRVITRASQPSSDPPPRSLHPLRVTPSHRATGLEVNSAQRSTRRVPGGTAVPGKGT